MPDVVEVPAFVDVVGIVCGGRIRSSVSFRY